MGNDRGERPVRKDSPFREWVSDNLRYIILIAVIAAAVIALLFILGVFRSDNSESPVSEAAPSETAAEAVPAEEPEKTGASSEKKEVTTIPTPVPEKNITQVPEKNIEVQVMQPAPADIDDIIHRYFAALSNADPDGVMAVTESITDSDITAITNGAYMRDYEDIECMTIPGAKDDEYVVLVTYTYSYPGYETRIPALTALYIIQGPDGEPCIASEDTEAKKQEVITKALAEPDAIELRDRVSALYDEALASDPELAGYIASLV